MRKTLLAVALTFAVALPAWSHDEDHDRHHGKSHLSDRYDHGLAACDLESPYSLKIASDSLSFSHAGSGPQRIELRGGRLIIDGRDVVLSSADRTRLLRFEAEVRAVLPEVLGLALEGVDIAFSAVHEVVRTFVKDGAQLERVANRLAQAQKEISARIEGQYAKGEFNERELGKAIEDTLREVVPLIAADVAAVAVAAALSGDENFAEDIERRAAQLEKTIEREVEQRAKALERRAEALCPRIAALDTIESELDVRLADGARLDLVRRD